jgi:exopolysaccharide production protein ExoY
MTTLVHTTPVSFTPAAGIRDIDAGSAVGRTGIWLRKIDAGAALARTGKRLLDLLGAAAGLILLAPLFVLLATIVKISDPAGPVFYRQNRLGLRGRAIGVLKFRTMKWEFSLGPTRPYKTAQEAFTAMGRSDLCAEFELNQKVAADPRVSRLGAFLRRTSLDELPQLVNALLGDLSLVGPRPIVSQELEHYGEHGSTFLAVKPGITGLWQVSGRSNTSYEDRVKLDLTYIRNWSTWLDLWILARTLVVVAAQRGAV